MAKNDSEKKTYSKDMLIKIIARECRIDRHVVRKIYESLENNIASILSEADAYNNVAIRLFEGIVLNGVYIPEHDKTNNLTGETITVDEKIKPKFHITESYIKKLNL